MRKNKTIKTNFTVIISGRNTDLLKRTGDCFESRGITVIKVAFQKRKFTDLIEKPVSLIIIQGDKGDKLSDICKRTAVQKLIRHFPGLPVILIVNNNSLIDCEIPEEFTDIIVDPVNPELIYDKAAVYIELCQNILIKDKLESELLSKTEEIDCFKTNMKSKEQGYRNMVDLAQEGIIIINESNEITFVNSFMALMLGYKLKELKGKTIYEIMDDEGKAQLAYYVERRKKGIKELHEFEFLTKNGKYLKTLVNASPIINSKGEYTGASAMITDISEYKELELSLNRSVSNFENFISRQLRLIEDERLCIARFVHDETGQAMTALKIELEQLKYHLSDVHDVSGNLKQMIENVNSTIKKMYNISDELIPEILLNEGLLPAIETYCKKIEAKTGIIFNIIDVNIPVRNWELDVVLYRVILEAFTNIVRHSKATEASLEISNQDKHIVLTVKDNGIGVLKNDIEAKDSYGILGMKERVRSVNGEMVISSEKGTVVKAVIPIGQFKDKTEQL